MGVAWEVIAGQVVAPSSTFTALSMASGDTLTVRNTPIDAKPRLVQIWCDNQALGNIRIRSTKLHDNTQGIRKRIQASEVYPLLPWGFPQTLNPQDVLTAEQTGSAVAGDREGTALLLYYPNLPGIDGKFFTPEQVYAQIVNEYAVESTITLVAGPNWAGAQAFSAATQNFKANTLYAILGYEADIETLAIGLRGPQWGNMRIAVPGHENNRDMTRDWFVDVSKRSGFPAIPVFNSADAANIFVDAVADENVGTEIVTWDMVELGSMPQALK